MVTMGYRIVTHTCINPENSGLNVDPKISGEILGWATKKRTQ